MIEPQVKGEGEKFCNDCRAIIKIKAEICQKCGIRQMPPPIPNIFKAPKNKTTAALLALLLGGFGAHKFYLGKIWLGIVYLVFSWTLIPSIIAIIDFVLILVISNEKFNFKYNKIESTPLAPVIHTKNDKGKKFTGECIKPEPTTTGLLGTEKISIAPTLSKKEIALIRKRVAEDNAAMQAQRDAWDRENKRQPKRSMKTPSSIIVDLPAKAKRAKKKRLGEVEFSYLDTKNILSERNVVVHFVDDIYLKGFDLNRQSGRTFRLDRIQGLIISKDSGELLTPDEFVNNIKYC